MIHDVNDKPVAAHPYQMAALVESTELTILLHRATNRAAYSDRYNFRLAMQESGLTAKWRKEDTVAG